MDKNSAICINCCDRIFLKQTNKKKKIWTEETAKPCQGLIPEYNVHYLEPGLNKSLSIKPVLIVRVAFNANKVSKHLARGQCFMKWNKPDLFKQFLINQLSHRHPYGLTANPSQFKIYFTEINSARVSVSIG